MKRVKANKKIMLLAIIFILLLGGGYFYGERTKITNADELKLTGNVDFREVSLAFKESDRIAEVLVDAGDVIHKGDVLARLDTRELKLNIRKSEAELLAQENIVAELKNGTRPEDLRQAEANYRAAQASADNAAGVYARKAKIYASIEGISKQELDNAHYEAEARAASANSAAEALAKARNGARPEEIASAVAKLTALQEELNRQNFILSQYELLAPSDGVVSNRLLEPGDMANANLPVLKLSLLDKKWVRAYVSEKELGKIYEGQAARVYIDSKSEPIEGQIGYISSTAQFTPKNVESEELRTSLVYEIRVYVTDSDNVLRLGMPATVKITL